MAWSKLRTPTRPCKTGRDVVHTSPPVHESHLKLRAVANLDKSAKKETEDKESLLSGQWWVGAVTCAYTVMTIWNICIS